MSSPINPEMQPVWDVQMDLLQKLLAVCDKHNLRIWASAGTLLGTIRHQGFIPWDDDIDVEMMREDYDKLLALPASEFPAPYFLQSAYSEPHYFRAHAQLRNCETASIVPGDEKQSFNQGIFIDIFPIDAVPEEKQMRRQRKKARLIQKMMYWRNYWYTASSPLSRMVTYCYHLIISFIPEKKVYRYMENLFRRYQIEDYEKVDCATFYLNHNLSNAHAKSDYSETLYLPFEHIQMPVPVGYNHILEEWYGSDYMTPKQVPSMHGGGVIFDAKRSYKEVLAELKQNKK